MIENSDKTDNSRHKINQNQYKKEIFAHGGHHRNIETEQKYEATVDDEYNDVGRKYNGVETVQCEFSILFGKQVPRNQEINHKVSYHHCYGQQTAREPGNINLIV